MTCRKATMQQQQRLSPAALARADQV